MKMEKRKTKLQSKRKIVNAIKLFESKIDEKFISIEIITDTYYIFKTDTYKYSVNLQSNYVNKEYPDPDYS